MADLPTIANVSRPLLGGGDLNINDHDNYVLVGPSVMSGTVQWDRKSVSTPWMEGDVTISRRRGNVSENISVYVFGTSQTDMLANLATLIDAFTQDRFTLQIQIDTAVYAWDCEAADYSYQMDTPHMYGRQVVVNFSVPRKPVMLAGGF